jgi:hypothetical protein
MRDGKSSERTSKRNPQKGVRKMKKLVFLLAVAGVIGVLTGVQVVISQDVYSGSFSGTLLRYNNDLAECSGSTVTDVGHVIQFSTNGGSTWIDGPTTDANSNFTYTPTVQYTGTMWVKAKDNCGSPPHRHIHCNIASFNYSYGYPGNKDLGDLFSVGCGGQR